MEQVWYILSIILTLVVSLTALFLTAFRLPGIWLLLVYTALYGWWTDWQVIGGPALGIFSGAAVTGEVAEFLASAITTRKVGGSRQAAWGALIGGFLGTFFLAFLIPIPLVGSIIGAMLGCLLGAAIVEWSVRNRIDQGAKVGIMSAIGFVIGIAVKTAISMVLVFFLLTMVTCQPATA